MTHVPILPDRRRAAQLSGHPLARILVVDDNTATVNSLAVTLELQGHTVRQARDGIEGFDIAEKFLPQIAVVDQDMPRRNGLELARLIRTREWGKFMRLIALTGHDAPSIRSRAAANGFEVFCSKPVDPDRVHGIIQQLLSQPTSPHTAP